MAENITFTKQSDGTWQGSFTSTGTRTLLQVAREENAPLFLKISADNGLHNVIYQPPIDYKDQIFSVDIAEGALITVVSHSAVTKASYIASALDYYTKEEIDEMVVDYVKFKGWFDSSSALSAAYPSPNVGDYAYVADASPATTTSIYECATAGTWSDSGRTVDTSNVQTFADGQEVNDVHIIDDLTTGGADDVLSAEQGKKIFNFLGQQISYSIVDGKYITPSGSINNESYSGYCSINVETGDVIYIDHLYSKKISVYNNPSIIFYDSNDDIIDTLSGQTYYYNYILTIPQQCVRIAINLSYEYCTGFVCKKYNKKYVENALSSSNVCQFIVELDDFEVVDGRVNALNGSIENTGSVFRTIVFDVSEYEMITINKPITVGNGGGKYGCAFYDENGDFISGRIIKSSDKLKLVVPNNAKYFKYGAHFVEWAKEGARQIYLASKSFKEYITDLLPTNYSSITWNAVGDSNTYRHLYMDEVRASIGINYNNYGVGGSTLAHNSDSPYESIVDRVCGLNGSTAIPDADLWTISGGDNDILYISQLGTLQPTGSNYDSATVYGALQLIVEHILSIRKDPHLLLLTPFHTIRDSWSESQYPTTKRMIRQAIIDVGEYYAVPVVDLYKDGGVNMYNISRNSNPTTEDGVHLNNLGATFIGRVLTREIVKSLTYNDISL